MYSKATKSATMIACAGLLLFSAQQSAAVVLFSFGSSGAWLNVNTSNTLVWNFHWSGNTGYGFSSTDFQISAEPSISNTETILFSLYNSYGGAAGGGNNLIAGQSGTSLTELQITGSSNQFTFGPLTLTAGNYSIQLSSAVSGGKNDSFQVKANALVLVDSVNGALPSNLYTTDGNTTGTSTTVIPETSSSVLAALGVLFMLSSRRRNKAA